MEPSWGLAAQHLDSHLLVYHLNTLYLYRHADLAAPPVSFSFPLFSANVFKTFRSYLLCRPAQDRIAVFHFDLAAFSAPSLVAIWNLAPYKVSVACWAAYDSTQTFNPETPSSSDHSIIHDPSPSQSSLPSSPPIPYALLGTRDGTVLRLDLSSPGILAPLPVVAHTCSPASSACSPVSAAYTSNPCTPSLAKFISASPSPPPPQTQTQNASSDPDKQPAGLAYNQGTVSSIEAAPCGMGIYAIGYATGQISIVQLIASTLRPIHQIPPPTGSNKKITALAWHYSSKDLALQNLAVLKDGSDRLTIWTVDMFDSCKKIREIPMPARHAAAPTCASFLQWSKSGKVVRACDAGFLISDVRTKKVTTRSVAVPGRPVMCLLVRSNRGRAWAINSAGAIMGYNLLDGGSQFEKHQLPFVPNPVDTGTILDSPVIFLQNVRAGEITQVTITRSPRSASAASSRRRNTNDSQASSTRPRFSPSDRVGRESTSKNAPSLASDDSSILLCMAPVKLAAGSLFPAVLKNLAKVARPQQVPEFHPSQLTVEQYVLCAVFGGVFNTTACLAGTAELLLRASAAMPVPSFRASVLALLLRGPDSPPAHAPLLALLAQTSQDPSRTLVAALLYASGLSGHHPDAAQQNALLPLFKDALLMDKDAPPHPDHVHLSCTHLYSLGFVKEARLLYMAAHYYLEALVISFLGHLDAVPVLKSWHWNLGSYDEKVVNANQVRYLADVAYAVEQGAAYSAPLATFDSFATAEYSKLSAQAVPPHSAERPFHLPSRHYNHSVPEGALPELSSLRTDSTPASMTTTSGGDDLSVEEPKSACSDSSYSTSSSASSFSLFVPPPKPHTPTPPPQTLQTLASPASLHPKQYQQQHAFSTPKQEFFFGDDGDIGADATPIFERLPAGLASPDSVLSASPCVVSSTPMPRPLHYRAAAATAPAAFALGAPMGALSSSPNTKAKSAQHAYQPYPKYTNPVLDGVLASPASGNKRAGIAISLSPASSAVSLASLAAPKSPASPPLVPGVGIAVGMPVGVAVPMAVPMAIASPPVSIAPLSPAFSGGSGAGSGPSSAGYLPRDISP